MNDREEQKPDLLERSIAAMRNEPMPQGPSPRTFAETRTALRKAAANDGFWQKVITMSFTQKIAAAVGLTVGGLALYFILSLFNGFSGISYAQVAAQIRSARSMTFHVTVKPTGQPEMSLREMLMDPDKVRVEMPGGTISVTDLTTKRSMVLVAKTKTAMIVDLTIAGPMSRPSGPSGDFAEQFKKLADGPGEPAADKQIAGVTAKGFRVPQGNLSAVVYADPKTGVPLEVDYGQMPGVDSVVMNGFDFDANLDPSLFSVEPPPGYTVQTQKLNISLDLGENVVPILRAYAQHKQGHFPPKLDDWQDMSKTLFADATQPGQAEQLATSLSGNMGATVALMFQYKKGKDMDYLPDGAKLGDADKIILWYQPKGSSTYKAVYGDLHIAEVSADQLPSRPQP